MGGLCHVNYNDIENFMFRKIESCDESAQIICENITEQKRSLQEQKKVGNVNNSAMLNSYISAANYTHAHKNSQQKYQIYNRFSQLNEIRRKKKGKKSQHDHNPLHTYTTHMSNNFHTHILRRT